MINENKTFLGLSEPLHAGAPIPCAPRRRKRLPTHDLFIGQACGPDRRGPTCRTRRVGPGKDSRLEKESLSGVRSIVLRNGLNSSAEGILIKQKSRAT